MSKHHFISFSFFFFYSVLVCYLPKPLLFVYVISKWKYLGTVNPQESPVRRKDGLILGHYLGYMQQWYDWV